jgi:MFS family permease
LLLLSLAELLAMAVWFSASAVLPALTEMWELSNSGQAWLTMSVQIGFVVGAFGSAVLNLADRFSGRLMFTISALMAGLATALIPVFSSGPTTAIPLRFLSGAALAGVYPVGMKIMATWTREDRGLGIGLLVGALTVGSASPHLLNGLGGISAWRPVLFLAAASAGLGAVIAALFIREGPYRNKTPVFNWKHIGLILRDREVNLANLGYLGHMWELFAMWTWIPVFFLASFTQVGVGAQWASLAAFAVIAIGGLGSLLAGQLADRYGRTAITIASLLISGGIALGVGRLFGGNPWILVAVSLIWGFAVVADSAQFSACVSELADKRLIGTTLTLQTSLGFLLTLFTIRIIPTLVESVGWNWAFAPLALGPAIGVWAMATLRRSPEAVHLANGRK